MLWAKELLLRNALGIGFLMKVSIKFLFDKETSLKFQELLGNIPLEMMKLSDDIIDKINVEKEFE